MRRTRSLGLVLGSGAAVATLAPLAAFAAEVSAAAPADQLPSATTAQVEVVGRQPSAQSHDTGLSTSVTRSVQDTPQLISVIPHELIEQQQITTLEQALRDTPGITVAIGEGGTLSGDQFRIRGMDASNDIYMDGLRDFGVYTRDSFDYEEVQVLKGPSGVLFGRGTTGGAINIVSKTPKVTGDFLDVQGVVGNGEYYRATADLNHKINDTTAVRLNVMGNSTSVVDRDHVFSHRWGVAGAVAFGIGTPVSLELNYSHQQTHATPDYGMVIGAPTGATKALPVTEYGVPRNVYEQYTTDTDRNHADLLTGRFNWILNPHLTLSNDMRLATYERYFQYTSVDSCLTNAVTKQTCVDALIDKNPSTIPWITYGGGGPYSQRAWGAQDIASARGDFTLLGLKNEFVAGFDYNHQENRKAFYAYTLPSISSGVYAPGVTTAARNQIVIDLLTGGGSPPAGYTVFRPSVVANIGASGLAGTSITSNTFILDSVGSADDYAPFITERLYLHPTLSIIAGVRYDVYDAEFANHLITGSRTAFSNDSHLVSPRASLVWEPSPAQSVYVSYSKSATPVGTAIVGSANPITSATQAYAPDEGESYEAGAKGALMGGRLGWEAAYFHVDKSNAKQTDPVSGLIDAASSQKQTFKGVELGLTGRLTELWSVNLGYTYIDSAIRQNLSCATSGALTGCYEIAGTTGLPVTQVPKNAVSSWTSYKLPQLLRGLSVGGGITYQDGFPVNYTTSGTAPNLTLSRTSYVPHTFSLDGLIEYEAGSWRAAVNLYNLTDRLNYAQSFANRATPAQGRTVLFSLAYKFR